MKNKKHTLLIIEDNELNRQILVEILSAEYELLTASDGAEGLSCIRQSANIDLVLLDIHMPVKNGYEVLSAMAADPCLSQIPIIVTTGSVSVEEEVRCLELGAVDFIRKPYNSAIVRQRVKTIIRLFDSLQTLNRVEIDDATGAYTRNAFFLYAQEWINNNPDVEFTLAVSDIKGFKVLHDMYGDKAYDLLARIMSKTQHILNGKVLVGRYSLDQLLFLFPLHLPNQDEAEKEKMYEEYATRLSNELNATIKVGICEKIDHAKSIRIQTDLALTALSMVKNIYNRHTNIVGKDLLKRMQRKSEIEMQMEYALQNGQLEIFFQPKHASKNGAMIGAEALLRWNSPELGLLSPSEFVPIFEQNGFVVEADAFVWRETCRYLREWQNRGMNVVPISVNASRLDFTCPDFDLRLIDALNEFHVAPHLLHIEVTESIFANLPPEAIAMMNHCRECGILVELDDFGTGYSTLHSLAELPIDIVKFDQSFVRKLDAPREQLVMKGCVDLIKSLRLSSVAEGVETDENRQLIANLGIDAIQGFFYSKPMPLKDFEKYLQHAL